MKTMTIDQKSHLIQRSKYKSRHKTYGSPCMRSVIIPETRSPSSSAAPYGFHQIGGRCERSSERARSAMRVVCKYGQGNKGRKGERTSGWRRRRGGERSPFLAIVGSEDDHARPWEGERDNLKRRLGFPYDNSKRIHLSDGYSEERVHV